MKRKNQIHKKRFDAVDVVVVVLLTLWMLLVIVPFVNAISISFATQKEYVDNPLMLFPSQPTLQSYKVLLNDYRIWVGFRTSFLLVVVGVPVSMLLTTMLAYGTSRGNYPGKKIIIGGILFTMLFNGGIIPLYLQMKEMGLTNTIWSVVLAGTVNVFYFVIMRNYFQSLPESLIESARLDGAGEWRILFDIILPLSKPIIATLTLFYLVDRWNEWYNALIFIRNTDLQPLQLVLRSIVMESSIVNNVTSAAAMEQMQNFNMGVKMAAHRSRWSSTTPTMRPPPSACCARCGLTARRGLSRCSAAAARAAACAGSAWGRSAHGWRISASSPRITAAASPWSTF